MTVREDLQALFLSPEVDLEPNERCPICGSPIVVASNVMTTAYGGSMVVQRPSAELIGACPRHGRSPFNDASIRYRQAAEAAGGPEVLRARSRHLQRALWSGYATVIAVILIVIAIVNR